jgi:serine/threonine protein kinase
LQKLKSAVNLETAFGSYAVDELLGEGGAGRVFGGRASDGTAVAVKVLSEERACKDKRSRFKKEIAFLSRNKHLNIVTVTDYGIAKDPKLSGSFYVMKKYETNLRNMMRAGLAASDVLPLVTCKRLMSSNVAYENARRRKPMPMDFWMNALDPESLCAP